MLAYGGHTSVCRIREKIKTRTGMLHPHDCSCGFLAAFEKADAALAATPQPEPAELDVERLAEALHEERVGCGQDRTVVKGDPPSLLGPDRRQYITDHRAQAERIIARLQRSSGEDG
jgi:hypothetical protein